jgi:hypothetical protein
LKSKAKPRKKPRSKEIIVIEPKEATRSNKIRRSDHEQQN